MESFQSILAPIDLSRAELLGEERYDAAEAEPIPTALWAARKTGGRLTLFSALDVPHDGPLSADERSRVLGEAERAGLQSLERLVAYARQQGVEAETRLVHGKAWVEIVRQAVRHRHDLIIAGPAERLTPWRFLLGSTVMKVVHHCPCPVWVAKPRHETRPQNILIANDLGEASEEILRVGLSAASLVQGKVYLLHVVDDPLARVRGVGLIKESSFRYVEAARIHAERVLAEQLARSGEPAAAEVELHVVKGSRLADAAILEFVDQHRIDLLVMGTVSRSGPRAVLVGNTAERLLPYVSCSLLAVKPKGFASPIVTAADDDVQPAAHHAAAT